MCACLQEPKNEGELRTEKAVSELPRSSGLDAVTPVGLHQAIVTTLGATDVGPQPQVWRARASAFLGDSGGIPLFPNHRDTSSWLPILKIPPPPAGRCLLEALSLEFHFFGL